MIVYHDNQFQKTYETSRLQLRILDESDALMVLTFLNQGADVFDEYESNKPSDFYTKDTQRRLLRLESDMVLQKRGVRFYVFRKENPHRIIGTISVSAIRPHPFDSGMVGYKFHPLYWGNGYATEALEKVTQIVGPILGLRRLEAFVLPENNASCKLLERVGFKLEGTAHSALDVKGYRKDHLQYGFVIPN